jgi:hypothetical protein
MADQKLTALLELLGTEVDAENDLLYIVDADANESKKISVQQLVEAMGGGGGDSVLFQATSSLTTDINTSAVVSWDVEHVKDSGFTHDSVSTPSQISFDEAGRYLVNVSLSFEGSRDRANPGVRLRKNGTDTLDGEGLHGYIRNYSGHNESTNGFMRFIEVEAGDYIEVITSQEAASGTLNLRANQSILYIEKK